MEFSVEQLNAIELLARGGKSNEEVAELVGVSVTTIYNWKNKNDFISIVIEKAQDYFKQDLSDVYNRLAKNAKSGDNVAIKLFLEHIENIEKLKARKEEANISFSWNISENA